MLCRLLVMYSLILPIHSRKRISEKAKEVSEKVNDILLALLFRFFILSRQNIQKWTKQNL